LKLEIIRDITSIADDPSAAQAEWNAHNPTDNPFCRYEFLSALELSGCCTADTGWQPHHLMVVDDRGATLALVPSYLKNNSYGEYVFDWAWADAYHRHGFNYYPKLLSAIPFTPSVGPRILTKNNHPSAALVNFLRQATINYLQAQSLSSWHFLFPDKSSILDSDPERQKQKEHGTSIKQAGHAEDDNGLMHRHGTQFQWLNPGYDNFAAFLGSMTSRKRKNIRKERQRVEQAGIECQWLHGREIDDTALEHFYRFYQLTYLKRGQQPYLNRTFFRLIVESMPDQIHLVLANHRSNIVAGALFFSNQTTLFGRYWGCSDEFNHLHFECCYYQGIDFAIKRGLQRFDAGAQGEHKIQRGFEPVLTHSHHWISHPGFRAAISDYVQQEQLGIEAYMQDAKTYLPFKNE